MVCYTVSCVWGPHFLRDLVSGEQLTVKLHRPFLYKLINVLIRLFTRCNRFDSKSKLVYGNIIQLMASMSL